MRPLKRARELGETPSSISKQLRTDDYFLTPNILPQESVPIPVCNRFSPLVDHFDESPGDSLSEANPGTTTNEADELASKKQDRNITVASGFISPNSKNSELYLQRSQIVTF